MNGWILYLTRDEFAKLEQAGVIRGHRIDPTTARWDVIDRVLAQEDARKLPVRSPRVIVVDALPQGLRWGGAAVPGMSRRAI